MEPIKTTGAADGAGVAALRGAGPAIACVSAGVIAWQLALMQLLAWVHWHHFAYLVISLALLGFGAAGTAITVARERLLADVAASIRLAACGAAAAMALATTALASPVLRVEMYLLFADASQPARLAALFPVLALPFFCSGLVIALALTADTPRAGALYAWNLGGSGAGGMAGWLLLGLLEPVVLCAALAALPLAAALLVRPSGRARGWRRHGPVVAAAVCVAVAIVHPAPLRSSQFKDLSRLLDLPGAAVVLDSPDPRGRLQIVAADAFRPAPPGSLRFAGEYPRQSAVLIDGNLRGSILAESHSGAHGHLDYSLESVAWRIAGRPRVLLLSAGGEGLAAWSLKQGAEEVVCVEAHPALAGEIARVLPHGARVVREDPRIALAQAGPDFDVIRFPAAGAFGGTAGLQAVGEQFLHTREAVAAALGRLAADGVVVATAWLEQPERSVPRLLSTIIGGLELAGAAEPMQHIVAVRSWNAVTFLVKRTPLSPAGIAEVRRACDELEFDLLLLPGLAPDERERFHELPGTRLFALVDEIAAGDPAGGGGVFRLGAATDGRPYFSQFLKITRLPEVAAAYGWRTAPYVELGYLIVAVSAPLLAVLALGLILAPLSRLGWRGGSRWRTAGFCAGIGFGFMFAEMGLIARLNLNLGGAVPAAATTLTVLLVFAGAGSICSQNFPPTPRTLVRIALAILASIVLLGVLAGALPPGAGLHPWMRTCVAAVLIAPPAFVMGMAFPTLLRFLGAVQPSHVPWAWAVNGCASVVAPSISVILAVNLGLPALFAASAAAYAVAALTLIGWGAGTRREAGPQ